MWKYGPKIYRQGARSKWLLYLIFHHPMGIFSPQPHTQVLPQTFSLHVRSKLCLCLWLKEMTLIFASIFGCSLINVYFQFHISNRVRNLYYFQWFWDNEKDKHIICGYGIIGLASLLLWNGHWWLLTWKIILSESIFAVFTGI